MRQNRLLNDGWQFQFRSDRRANENSQKAAAIGGWQLRLKMKWGYCFDRCWWRTFSTADCSR